MTTVDQVKEEILSKADIVEVVSQYVQLKSHGGRYFGLCPFHKEKTPSFSVHPERRFFHCFGCGKSGHVIDFVMEVEHLTYPEARRFFAQKLGIRMEETSGRKRTREDIDRFQVMDLAAQVYAKWLQGNSNAYQYVLSRGLLPEQIQQLGLGCSPDSWDSLYTALIQRGIPEEVQLELGLVIPRQKGNGYYDRFRNRIMFPIRNTLGRIIAFGGRALDPNEPAKYLNSNDTPLFNKSRVLYLLDRAKEWVKERGAVIVEGYMDAIALHSHGFQQAVATLGTALTKEHLTILRRYTQSFTLLYDGDTAGVNAAKRGVETFFESGFSARTALLPEGMDPDDFVRKEGTEALQGLLDRAKDGFDFYLDEVVKKYDPSLPKGKSAIVNEMIPLLSRIPEAFVRKDYIRLLAQRIGSEVPLLEASIARSLKKGIYRRSPEKPEEIRSDRDADTRDPIRIVKESLLRLLAFHHGFLTPPGFNGEEKPSLFSSEELEELIPTWLERLREGERIDRLLSKLLAPRIWQGESAVMRLSVLFPENEDLTAFLAVTESEPLPATERALQKWHDELLEAIRLVAEKRQREELLRQEQGDYRKALQALDQLMFGQRKDNPS